MKPSTRRLLVEDLRPVFPRASRASLARLVEIHRRRESAAGRLEDARSSEPAISFLLEGHVSVIQHAPDGRVSILGVFGPGGLIGLGSIDGEPQVTELEALEHVLLAEWPAMAVRDIAARDQAMLLDVVDQLVTRMRGAMFLLERQTFATAGMRLASALLRNEGLVFSPESPRISRRQLAALASVSREMVGRILRRWERASIIRRVGRNGLVLVDRHRLEAEAEGAESLSPRTGLPAEMS